MEIDGFLALIGLAIREVLLLLIWLRVLAAGGFLTLEPEFSNILPLKELLEDLRELELFEVEGRETIDLLVVLLLGELLRVTLELLLVEGLEVLTLELLLVEGLEVLTLELLLVEGLEVLTLELLLVEGLEVLTLALLRVEGLEVLTLALLLVEGLEELTLALLLVEGLEVLTLELLLVEGLEVLALELEGLEELEALDGAELFEEDRLLPLDLLDFFAITGPAGNIKAKVTDSRISPTFFECFRVYMACLLILARFFRFYVKSEFIFTCLHHYKAQNTYQKTPFQELFIVLLRPCSIH